jgi:hypothetical protein
MLSNAGNHSNQNIAKLILLQAKEYYYYQQFSPHGKYLPQCAFSHAEYEVHKMFMNWLFPLKDFIEWDIVVWHHPEGVTYYQNKIFNLTKGVTPCYEKEIISQIKMWRKVANAL